jgi:hypothetical protein
MMRSPMAGDVETTTEPHLIVPLHIIEKPCQGSHMSGTSDEATVQADRHHYSYSDSIHSTSPMSMPAPLGGASCVSRVLLKGVYRRLRG